VYRGQERIDVLSAVSKSTETKGRFGRTWPALNDNDLRLSPAAFRSAFPVDRPRSIRLPDSEVVFTASVGSLKAYDRGGDLPCSQPRFEWCGDSLGAAQDAYTALAARPSPPARLVYNTPRVSLMSAGTTVDPRFQDLSRQQAFGVEARVLQRMFPLLTPKEGAKLYEIEEYFVALADFSYILSEVGLGNQLIEDAKPQGKRFHDALDRSRLFVDKSIPAAEAVMCVTDALGDLGLIRYFVKPGVSARDQRNADLSMLTVQASFTLSKIGMKEEVFENPAAIDCAYVLSHRLETEPFVPPEFYTRDLWPTRGPSLADRSMPFGFEVIQDEWRDSLRSLSLSGVVSSYDGFLQGMHLVQNHKSGHQKEASVVNNVTLNFSNGSSFTGPLAVGQNIKLSYEMAENTKKDDLRSRLEQVVTQASKLAEAVEPEEQKDAVSAQLKTFVEEAKKEKPNKWSLNVSSSGLLEAAKTVASLAEPVTTAVEAVLALLNPAG
jgi:hypothetical protein